MFYLALNSDYHTDPSISASTRTGFINHGSVVLAWVGTHRLDLGRYLSILVPPRKQQRTHQDQALGLSFLRDAHAQKTAKLRQDLAIACSERQGPARAS